VVLRLRKTLFPEIEASLEVDCMDEEVQRRLELAATLGLAPRYLLADNSGRSRWSKFELDTYLVGPPALSRLEYGHSAGKRVKRPAAGRQQEASSPAKAGRSRSRPGNQRRTREHSLSALGAAGKFPAYARTSREGTPEITARDGPATDRAGGNFRPDRSCHQEFFDVGAAALSPITRDAQHFKSAVGPLREQTPRQIALCTATVERNTMLIINDTLTDDRFASNPLVVGEPHIRFYAGYPLHGPRGWNIGTLCIIDQKPRAFPPAEQQVLRTLAAIVQHHIDARA
jgi:hypothetical protein